jgi:hypothetical protein
MTRIQAVCKAQHLAEVTASKTVPSDRQLWWLTLAIPATREAEIRRIKDQSQPRQTVHETLS